MKGLTTIRWRKSIWGRRALNVVALAWLSVILQPCAMGLGEEDLTEEHQCPHCPPVEKPGPPPCEVLSAPECALDDQANVDLRYAKLKVEDAPDDLSMAIQPAVSFFDSPCRVSQPSPVKAHLLNPSGPPLNVLYCVYLK